MVRRAGLLLAFAVLPGALTGCLPRVGSVGVCVPYNPADPVALFWSENIDDDRASVEHFAPPRLEIMSDGRAIADATAVQTLSPDTLGALTRWGSA